MPMESNVKGIFYYFTSNKSALYLSYFHIEMGGGSEWLVSEEARNLIFTVNPEMSDYC